MATIRLPAPLRQYAGGQTTIVTSGKTINDALGDLITQYPDLRTHLYSEDELRSFVNIYLNQEDIRYLDGANTTLNDSDRLMIVPSIAGGY